MSKLLRELQAPPMSCGSTSNESCTTRRMICSGYIWIKRDKRTGNENTFDLCFRFPL
jgi:hypothetical protein